MKDPISPSNLIGTATGVATAIDRETEVSQRKGNDKASPVKSQTCVGILGGDRTSANPGKEKQDPFEKGDLMELVGEVQADEEDDIEDEEVEEVANLREDMVNQKLKGVMDTRVHQHQAHERVCKANKQPEGKDGLIQVGKGKEKVDVVQGPVQNFPSSSSPIPELGETHVTEVEVHEASLVVSQVIVQVKDQVNASGLDPTPVEEEEQASEEELVSEEGPIGILAGNFDSPVVSSKGPPDKKQSSSKKKKMR
ncbi:hypothetical protein U1Q18_017993 [Sarracenia purpurea var. burkii]